MCPWFFFQPTASHHARPTSALSAQHYKSHATFRASHARLSPCVVCTLPQGPYLAERASSALDALGTACEDGGRCEAPGQQPSHCGRGGLSCGPGSSVEDASRLGGISGLRDDPAPGRVAGVRAWAALRAWQARQWLAATWGPALFIGARALSTHGMRLHLALFYLWGVFYQLPLRLAGVRFASIARPLQQ